MAAAQEALNEARATLGTAYQSIGTDSAKSTAHLVLLACSSLADALGSLIDPPESTFGPEGPPDFYVMRDDLERLIAETITDVSDRDYAAELIAALPSITRHAWPTHAWRTANEATERSA